MFMYTFRCESCKKVVKRVKRQTKALPIEVVHSGLCDHCDHPILVQTVEKLVVKPKEAKSAPSSGSGMDRLGGK